MARAKFVKAAGKDYPEHGIKKGESFWWWKFRYGGIHRSKTQPKPSQLTQSNFWSQVHALSERDEPDADDLEGAIDEIKSELENIKDEVQSSLDNMPEGLQQGSTGELLQERIDACDSAIDELDSIDLSDLESMAKGDEDEDETDEEFANRRAERASELWGEVTDALGNISCG